MVREKKDCWYIPVVLAGRCLNLCSFAALVRQLAGANKGGSAAMGVPPLMNLCDIINLAFFLLSSSEDQSSLCSISVTLLRLLKSPTTKPAVGYVAALLPISLCLYEDPMRIIKCIHLFLSIDLAVCFYPDHIAIKALTH